MMIYEVENLNFTYPGGNRKILDDVSLTLAEGEIMSVLGPNGAGKSTLLNCLAALSKPDSGTIKLAGRPIETLKVKEIASTIGYVPQNHVPAFSYTVLNFVLMGRAPKIGMFERPSKEDVDAAMKVICEMGLEALAEKPYTEISGGERQQATIARAVVQKPKAILFDEPTAHLDYGNQLKTLRMIKNLSDKGYAVIITTHNPDHAILLGGTAAILDSNGKLRTGKCSEVITEEALRSVYNTDLKLMYIEEMGRMACISPNL